MVGRIWHLREMNREVDIEPFDKRALPLFVCAFVGFDVGSHIAQDSLSNLL